MENTKILSIVIPAYNVEKYLWETIPTMVDSRIISDIEIIIISDGSKDRTVEISHELIKKYGSNIKVVDKPNGGHGSVINKGIEIAQGKYFKVIDGDDWVDTEELVRLVNDLKTTDADLVVNGYKRVSDANHQILESIDFEGVPHGEELVFDEVCNCGQYVGIHAFSIKTEILRKHKIAVREKVFYEDTQFILYPIPYVKTTFFSTANVYRYRVDSATQSVNINNLKKNRNHRSLVISDLLEYYDRHQGSMSNEVKAYYVTRLTEAVAAQYKIFSAFGKNDQSVISEIIEFSKTLKSYSVGKEILKSNRTLTICSAENAVCVKLVFCVLNYIRVRKGTWK